MLQEASFNTLLFKGADRNKLVLGFSLYGRTFKLKNRESVGVQRESEGAGMPGPYMQGNGFWGYNEVSLCSCDGISRRETE